MRKLRMLSRTISTFLNPHQPYYAHLCVTERCNLRCRYCQVWSRPSPELGVDQWKQIIDKAEQMGVAFLIFTGGEPLLYNGIFELIDHAASTGLATAITSNGSMGQARYTELLQTQIDKITISLDDIEGDDLPYSHTSPKILDTIRLINERRGERIFTVSTVLHENNQGTIPRVVEFCQDNGIAVFIQPVVTGTGKLRKEGSRVSPKFPEFPNILNPPFFNKACDEYARRGRLHWNCLGGQLFFDIKPNGDFWLCQDYPTSLNLLDPGFDERWASYDFHGARQQCESGCIYSCYLLTREGLRPKNVSAMVGMGRKISQYRTRSYSSAPQSFR